MIKPKVLHELEVAYGTTYGFEEAAALMLKEGISRLPVMRKKKRVGILARADIINAVGSSYSVKGELIP